MDSLQPGQVMEVTSSDAGLAADIENWTKTMGHHYLGMKEEGAIQEYYLQKSV
jgi:TusA-related sulfurtransferase